MSKQSNLEEILHSQFKLLGLSAEPEYKFAAEHVGPGPGVKKRLQEARLKNWRFDFAFPEHRFAVEIEGGGWTNGRHTRGKGFEDDMHKYHHAMRLGWTVYRCAGALIKSGEAVGFVEDYLKGKIARGGSLGHID